jgi:hypothetical protein
MGRAFHEIGPGRLQVREGGGGIAVFGLPFLLVGIGVTLSSLGLLPIRTASDFPSYGGPLMLLMGLVFSLVGGVLVLGRSWTTLDAASRTVTAQLGLLVPMSTTTYRIDDYASVVVDFQPGDSDTAEQFPVSLKARAGKNLRLFSSTGYAEARERAIAIANLFRIDLEDASTDHALTLSPAQADLSLQNRVRLDHQREPLAVRPAAMRTAVTTANGNLEIVIPARRVHPLLFAFYLIPVAAPVYLVAPFTRFFRQSNTPDVVSWIFVGFLTIAFGVLPVVSGLKAYLRNRFGRTTVTVSTIGIRIDERRIWKTRPKTAIDAAEILDVDYSTSDSLIETVKQKYQQKSSLSGQSDRQSSIGPATQRALVSLGKFVNRSCITIKTRRGLTTFGEGLGDEEIRYLHSVVRRALVDGSMPIL